MLNEIDKVIEDLKEGIISEQQAINKLINIARREQNDRSRYEVRFDELRDYIRGLEMELRDVNIAIIAKISQD